MGQDQKRDQEGWGLEPGVMLSGKWAFESKDLSGTEDD